MNIRIIDTPTLQIMETWHEDETINTWVQKSDLVIVLISGTVALTSEEMGFLSSQRSRILSQCVFVVSKLDFMYPKERGKIMQFIKAELEDELGQKKSCFI